MIVQVLVLNVIVIRTKCFFFVPYYPLFFCSSRLWERHKPYKTTPRQATACCLELNLQANI